MRYKLRCKTTKLGMKGKKKSNSVKNVPHINICMSQTPAEPRSIYVPCERGITKAFLKMIYKIPKNSPHRQNGGRKMLCCFPSINDISEIITPTSKILLKPDSANLCGQTMALRIIR